MREYSISDAALWAKANQLRDLLAPTWQDREGVALQEAEPALQLNRYTELQDELSRHPAVSSRGSIPYSVGSLTHDDEARLIPLFNELHRQVEALRRAAQFVFRDDAGTCLPYVAATIEDYCETHELAANAEFERYNAISMQDLLYQVPDAIADVRRLGKCTNLELLIIFGNHMKSLPFKTDKLQKLRYIQLAQNDLGTFPRELLACRALEGIDLSRNGLTTVPAEELATLTNLRELNVRGNRLTAQTVNDLEQYLPDVHVLV